MGSRVVGILKVLDLRVASTVDTRGVVTGRPQFHLVIQRGLWCCLVIKCVCETFIDTSKASSMKIRRSPWLPRFSYFLHIIPIFSFPVSLYNPYITLNPSVFCVKVRSGGKILEISQSNKGFS